MRNLKKILSFLLAFSMVLTLVPIPALAAEGDACTVTAECTGVYVDGVCNVCGESEPTHTHVYDGDAVYAQKDDSVHTVTRACTTCEEKPTETVDEAHTYVDGRCVCGKEAPTHTHVYDGDAVYAQKDDSVHTVTRPCTSCQEKPTQTIDEPHTYTDGLCPCGKEEPSTDDVGDGSSVPPAPVDEALEAVKAQLEALPTLEELSAMTRDEKIALHDTAYLPAGNAYNALTEEQKAQVDATKLMALGAYFADPNNLMTTDDPATSGTTGDCYWSFDESTGTLTISGNGAMEDYVSSNLEPWAANKTNIKKVIIENGVKAIGTYAFSNYSSLQTVTIPASVTAIGSNAFYNCTSLKTVKYEGTTAPTASSNVFLGTNLLFVSVPWNYEPEKSRPTFCGKMAKREDKPTTYTVTFDMQNHGTAIEQQTITSGGKVTEPTAPTAEGYTFGGWYTDSACTTGKEWDFNTPVTASTTLYAKWTEDTSGGGESGDTTYTVTFVDGEGSGTMDAVTVNSGAEYTLPACTFTAPSGKEFKAWSVDGAEKAVGDTITVSTDTTVTALWKDAAPTTYTITIPTINYGNVTTNKETAAAGDTVTLTVEPAVGYGLNTITANNGAVTLTPDTTNLTKYTFTMPESNVTVTADFIKISVTIKSGDTDVTNQEIQLHAGKTVQLTEAVTPANASYNGAVWYSDSDSVAAVKQDGKVTAVNEGTAVITVQVGDVSASCKVKVDAHD